MTDYNDIHKRYDHPPSAAPVTPNDSTDLANPGILYIGTAGALKITTLGGDTITMGAVAQGFLPIPVKRVFSSGTVASNISVHW